MEEFKLNELTILENNSSFLLSIIDDLNREYIKLLREKADQINVYLTAKSKKKYLELELQDLEETSKLLTYEESVRFPESDLEDICKSLLQSQEIANQIYGNKVSVWICQEEKWKDDLQNALDQRQQEIKQAEFKRSSLEDRKLLLKTKLKQLEEVHSQEFIKFNRSLRPQVLALEERRNNLQKELDGKEIECKKKILELQTRLNNEQNEALKINEQMDKYCNNYNKF